MKKALCIISGGMDSTLCAYLAKKEGYEIVALHFDYSQRTMKKEKDCFLKICDDLKVFKKEIFDVRFIAQIGANALTDKTINIPKNNLESKQIPITYVPFRNGIFLSIAAALAEKEECEAIYIGVVEEDSSGYPDCSEEFVKSFEKSINLGRATKYYTKIKMPLVHLSKAEIVKIAMKNNVPLEYTWSCYESEYKACGECDSCKLRLKGFQKAGFVDKIPYKFN